MFLFLFKNWFGLTRLKLNCCLSIIRIGNSLLLFFKIFFCLNVKGYVLFSFFQKTLTLALILINSFFSVKSELLVNTPFFLFSKRNFKMSFSLASESFLFLKISSEGGVSTVYLNKLKLLCFGFSCSDFNLLITLCFLISTLNMFLTGLLFMESSILYTCTFFGSFWFEKF